ncbi:MAG: transporter substrate-binding domain-containing protein [Methylocystaceae bacterium]|nr:transporter substrate-binding domain-containing protein [Methylocystaceae bacterium]
MRYVFFYNIFVILCGLAVCNPSFAQEKKHSALIAVPHIAQLVQKQEDERWGGPLIDVLNRLAAKSQLDFSVKVVPFKRAVLMTQDGVSDFGVFMESEKRDEIAIPVLKLGDAYYVIVSLADTPITRMDQLKGKTVGQIRGGTKVLTLSAVPDITYKLFNKHEDGVRMLKGKRIDALLTADFRVLEAIEQSHLQTHEIAKPLPIEARALWLYWSWHSKLPFEEVHKLRDGPAASVVGLDPSVLFSIFDQK